MQYLRRNLQLLIEKCPYQRNQCHPITHASHPIAISLPQTNAPFMQSQGCLSLVCSLANSDDITDADSMSQEQAFHSTLICQRQVESRPSLDTVVVEELKKAFV